MRVVTESVPSAEQQIKEVYEEIRGIKRDLYGNPNIREAGVFSRLDLLEDKFSDLIRTYTKERIEKSALENLEVRVDELALNYRLSILYLRGIAGAIGTLTFMFVGAVITIIVHGFGGN